jgi:hypothetical protein
MTTDTYIVVSHLFQRNSLNYMNGTMRPDRQYPFLRSTLVTSSTSSLLLQQEPRALSYLNLQYQEDDEFLNDYDAASVQDTLLLTFYSLLAIAFGFLAYFTIRLVYNTKELQEFAALRVWLPAVSVYMALECVTLAVDEAIPQIPQAWGGILYIVEATVAPGLLLSTFVVTFVAYRIRSMPFCCVRRRPQSETNNTDGPAGVIAEPEEPLVQPAVLTLAMNTFAGLLFLVGILVNFDIMWSSADLAGRTGWVTLLLDPWEPSFVHILSGLIPMTIVCGVCVYFAGLLFRYGNELSMTIYSSFLNPWMWPVAGVVAMFGGILPPSPWFPLTSNLGICIYQVTILRVLFEIRKDLGQASELGSYLRACWETPAGVDVTTSSTVVDEVIIEQTQPADRTGILRRSTTSSKKVAGERDVPKIPDSTLL